MAARGLEGDLWGLHPDDFGAPAASITTVLNIYPFVDAKLRVAAFTLCPPLPRGVNNKNRLL